eukprot:scaffold53011_cov36-Tisochrysis_lutea.AAC.3
MACKSCISSSAFSRCSAIGSILPGRADRRAGMVATIAPGCDDDELRDSGMRTTRPALSEARCPASGGGLYAL